MANVVIKSDDAVECFLYPKFCLTKNFEQVTEEKLIEEINKYYEATKHITKDYIWHKESLTFFPRTKRSLLLETLIEGSKYEDNELVPHIYVKLHFDEDVGDEWFTVYLINYLTKVFDGLIARVTDSDGEFLLIESANALPSWANPEVCEKRVFISNGSIHVIPDKDKSLLDNLNSINKNANLFKLSEAVQSIIQKRISIYPDEIKERTHKARAYLPEKAAFMLQEDPGLIAPAIRRLFHSDPFERKVCRGMKFFPPEQRTMVNIRMTKCLYAMIMHCRYTGDPMTGWNLPPVNSTAYSAHLLGVKIACGLEMLISSAYEEQRKKANDASAESTNDRLKMRERTLNAFVSRLELSGYFKDLLEGSQERERLLQVAKDYFSNKSDSNKLLHMEPEHDKERVLKVWGNIQTNDVDFTGHEETTLSPSDNDDWLNVNPVELENLLGERWGDKSSKTDKLTSQTLRRKIQNFLKETSGVEGVQLFSDNDLKLDVDDSGKIEFDTDAFDIALRDILDLAVPGGDGEFEDSSEESLGGDDEDKCGEMDDYMRQLDNELRMEKNLGLVQNEKLCETPKSPDKIESNLLESLSREAGGSGPTGNIIGGPIRKFMHLQLQSPSTVPPDLQS
ncbi:protein ecdysoneless [Leptopilina heterotoma]|uniref:protein ecdysoneless n=1 Tax=Leptopilina heterotoma TaxID=63436 RepID=UPI001CA7DF0D|nr:protein ecdysoneless [Leptopilina heterotoma]